jgi:hypothetical protein
MGTAALIWGLSGAGALYDGGDPVTGLESGDAVRQQGEGSVVAENGTFNTSAQNSGGSDNIVGVVLSGVSYLTEFAALVALLPLELQALGFPVWFAAPIGLLVQALAGIGIVQFAAGRIYR